MATVVMDRNFAEHLRQQRSAAGADRWDEIWEGTYMMTPLPNNEHQQIANRLAAVCENVCGWGGHAIVMQGTNVSDRIAGWEHNYRCPDVAVYLAGNLAKNCNTHWCGRPDFALEIVSDDDRTRDKIPLYARVGTRELLIVEREPWSLELLRLHGEELQSVGTTTVGTGPILAGEALPLMFRLIAGADRPSNLVTHTADGTMWNV